WTIIAPAPHLIAGVQLPVRFACRVSCPGTAKIDPVPLPRCRSMRKTPGRGVPSRLMLCTVDAHLVDERAQRKRHNEHKTFAWLLNWPQPFSQIRSARVNYRFNQLSCRYPGTAFQGLPTPAF